VQVCNNVTDLFNTYQLYIVLGAMPSNLPINLTFEALPPTTDFSSCTSGAAISNIPPPLPNNYDTRVNGLLAQFSLTSQPANGNFGGKFYNQGIVSQVDGFMLSATDFYLRLYDPVNLLDRGQYIAEIYGTYTNQQLNFNTINLAKPAFATYLPNASSFVMAILVPPPPSPIGLTPAGPSDYYSGSDSAWIYDLGTAEIILFIVVIVVGIIFMKASDIDWIATEPRSKLYVATRILVIIGAVIVVASSIAVIILRKDCSNFSIIQSNITFQECSGSGCTSLQTTAACNGCQTCCVAVDTADQRIFGFCKESLVVWYGMVTPIGISLIAIIVVFLCTRSAMDTV